LANVQALEFFSGIGSFAEACRNLPVEVIAAFDQNTSANEVYESNFKLKPESRNLDTIEARRIPDAHLWWLSPPCTPYSRRGKQSDLDDARARSLLHLIEILPLKRPQYFFLENVIGFADSAVHAELVKSLNQAGYTVCEVDLCSTQFGVPMRRPRRFVIGHLDVSPDALPKEVFPGYCAGNEHAAGTLLNQSANLVRSANSLPPPPAPGGAKSLQDFLDQQIDPALIVSPAEVEKYERGFNIIDEQNVEAIAICFTKGYWRCKLASGSLIRMADGGVRRFSPREMLRLFGFSDAFQFPTNYSLPKIWQLIGNAVDVRAISYLLNVDHLPSETQG
jgi:DNA (cytosine-5)-methyltransferase 1